MTRARLTVSPLAQEPPAEQGVPTPALRHALPERSWVAEGAAPKDGGLAQDPLAAGGVVQLTPEIPAVVWALPVRERSALEVAAAALAGHPLPATVLCEP